MRDPMLASSLYQTGDWIKASGVVTTQVSSSYLKMQIDSHANEISAFLSSMLGENVHFEVTLHQIVHTPVEQTAPEQVKILCDVFKGQIIGHSKKTDQEIASDSQKNDDEKSDEKETDSHSSEDEEE